MKNKNNPSDNDATANKNKQQVTKEQLTKKTDALVHDAPPSSQNQAKANLETKTKEIKEETSTIKLEKSASEQPSNDKIIAAPLGEKAPEEEVPQTPSSDKTAPNDKKSQEVKEKNTASLSEKEQIKKEAVKKETAEKDNNVVIVKQGGHGLSLLALALVLAMGGSGFYFGNEQILQYQNRITDLTNQVNSLKSSVQTQTAVINEKQNQLNEKQVEINDKQKEIEAEQKAAEKALAATLLKAKEQTALFVEQQENSIAALQKAFTDIKGRRPNDWLIAEADHLVKQAGRMLWLEKDIPTTTLLMLAADKRIADLNDPSLNPLRQAIALDVQSIKAIEQVDTDGIVARLMTLQQQIETLPLTETILPPAQPEVKKTVSADVTDWKENLITSLDNFINQFVTYRVREGSATPLLSPDQAFYLEANLKAKLDQAINATFREDQKTYEMALQQASEWIARFYDVKAASTQSVLVALTELSALPVEIAYPSELKSQQLISDFLADRLRNAISMDNKGNNSL